MFWCERDAAGSRVYTLRLYTIRTILTSSQTVSLQLQHTHTGPASGPSPSTIRTITGFRSAGIYKLWFQFQRHGALITVPWVVKVGEPERPVIETAALPAGTIHVKLSSAGFEPARLEIPGGQATRIAFTRTDAQNCAGEVVFPELGVRKSLPPGQTVMVVLRARQPGELHFACGMGMYKGSVVIVGQDAILQPIGNRLGAGHETGQADCQSAAGCHPAPH